MGKKDNKKIDRIISFINEYYNNYYTSPTVREIAYDTNIPATTVHRYLKMLNEKKTLTYNGRKSIHTERMDMEQSSHSMPVVGYVACGDGQAEEQVVQEYIRLPESIIGNGDFFVVIAKGESMIEAGIFPGDYVVIDKTREAKIGDIVVALYEGKNNLKLLDFDKNKNQHILKSCNKDQELYPNIYTKRLSVQGVANCVIHKINKGSMKGLS